jgi:hypothetical protein
MPGETEGNHRSPQPGQLPIGQDLNWKPPEYEAVLWPTLLRYLVKWTY